MSSCMTGAAAAEVAIAVEDHPTVNTCTSLVTHTAGRLSRTLRSNRKSHNLSRSRLGSLRDLAPTHQSSRTTLDGSLDRPARPRRSWSVRRIRAKTKKVFSECLLGRWKDFDRETERAFQTQENIAYGFVKKIMAFFCFVHFCVACVISALSQV
ncbi:hypothetical protein BC832DRAFT_125710 [Gaertneriomyces semiglobifer]|nr:hypothetical protein BC832DRAFT_125710 [Gaertneriomyces semiglobifer]